MKSPPPNHDCLNRSQALESKPCSSEMQFKRDSMESPGRGVTLVPSVRRLFSVAAVILILAFLAQQVAAADVAGGLEDAGVFYEEDEFRVYAPDAGRRVAADSNFQRWLSHVQRTTTTRSAHHRRHTATIRSRNAATNSSQAQSTSLQPDKADDHTSSHPAMTILPTVLHRKHRRACPKKVIHVRKDGTGHFTTIQAAVKSVPSRNKCRVIIIIGPGVFREKVEIKRSKPHITLKGDPHRHTIIVWNDKASSLDKKGRRMSTMHSATVAINSNYFVAENITFMNTAPAQKPGAVSEQAVALRISGDKAAFFNCRFYAHQDTLYDHRGRHYFKNCFVTGTVDFIFGNGRSLYDGAELVTLADHDGIPGTITAQKRNETTPDTGFSFVNSRITGSGMVYLGRAWGNDSRVVFANSFMDKIVVPEGWGDWGIPAREKTVFYAQFNCTGPGADMSHRVHWSRNLTAAEAAPFLTPRFVNGEKWLEGMLH